MRLRTSASGAERWCALGAIMLFWAAPQLGVIFAAIIAFYWVADEIYPSVPQLAGA
jgi:hypothetical protein